jgi:uncharacterized membrane protein
VNPFLAAHSVSPFDLKAALLAGHAQHPVIVLFPIALFIASAVFEVLAIWRKQRVFSIVAYFNLLTAALSLPLTIATGLGAWQWQLEGAHIKGNLLLHLVCALVSSGLILILCWNRRRLRQADKRPSISYFAVMALALMMIALTGHVGGILSGVEAP